MEQFSCKKRLIKKECRQTQLLSSMCPVSNAIWDKRCCRDTTSVQERTFYGIRVHMYEDQITLIPFSPLSRLTKQSVSPALGSHARLVKLLLNCYSLVFVLSALQKTSKTRYWLAALCRMLAVVCCIEVVGDFDFFSAIFHFLDENKKSRHIRGRKRQILTRTK